MSKKIAVIHGGVGHEREKSMHYGKAISKIFKDAGNNVVEIHLHPNGSWTKNGKIEHLESALTNVEHVWNALVGEDGESGLVEKLCHKCQVKVFGHKKLHVDLAADKKKIKDALKQHNIRSPYSKTLKADNINSENLKHVYQMVGLPMVVKPLNGSGGKNIFLANNFSEYSQAVEKIFQMGKDALVEKPIDGKPFLVRNIRDAVERYFKKAGIDKAKINDLRHTFVAHHLRSGVSMVFLSKVLGHKRLSSTERSC
jgi:D-alanine-D-alanine ligase-like ATP-grasp enzyme